MVTAGALADAGGEPVGEPLRTGGPHAAWGGEGDGLAEGLDEAQQASSKLMRRLRQPVSQPGVDDICAVQTHWYRYGEAATVEAIAAWLDTVRIEPEPMLDYRREVPMQLAERIRRGDWKQP